MHLKRIGALIAAAPLVGMGFLAATAGSASAGVGTPIATKSQAGYEVSGRDFRFIEATLTVPDDSLAPLDSGLYPVEYLQLSNGTQLSTAPIAGSGDQYVRAGIIACIVANKIKGGFVCSNGGWAAFATTYSNSLGGPETAQFFNLANVTAGDGVQFSMYYDQQGGDVHFVINPPNASGNEPSFTFEEAAPGAIFDHAAALDDWTNSTGAPIVLPVIPPVQINSFFGGALTTYNGTKGSFDGAWATSEVEATSNALLPPSGTLVANPDALYGDGLKANGAVRPDDAFDEYAK